MYSARAVILSNAFARALAAPLVFLVALFSTPPAGAAFEQVTFALEPGLATLSEASGRSWGGLGGLTAATNITERLYLQLHIDHKRFPLRDEGLQATAWNGAVLYNIDVGRVTPYIQLGGAVVSLLAEDEASYGPAIVPVLGAGFDVGTSGVFIWGFTVRYYPIFGTDLLSNPAYVTINAKLGVRFGGV